MILPAAAVLAGLALTACGSADAGEVVAPSSAAPAVQTQATTAGPVTTSAAPPTTTPAPAGPSTVTEKPDPAPTSVLDDAGWADFAGGKHGKPVGPIVPVPAQYWANFASDDKAQYGGRDILGMVAVDLDPSAGDGSNWIVVAKVADKPLRMAAGSVIRVSYPAWFSGDISGTTTPVGKPGAPEPLNRSAWVHQTAAAEPDQVLGNAYAPGIAYIAAHGL